MNVLIKHSYNYYLGQWDQQRHGYYAELVDTDAHPSDCQCVECKPRPEVVYRERDELDDKQDRLFFK